MGFLSNDVDSWGGAEMMNLEMTHLRWSWALLFLLLVLGEDTWEGSAPDRCRMGSGPFPALSVSCFHCYFRISGGRKD